MKISALLRRYFVFFLWGGGEGGVTVQGFNPLKSQNKKCIIDRL